MDTRSSENKENSNGDFPHVTSMEQQSCTLLHCHPLSCQATPRKHDRTGSQEPAFNVSVSFFVLVPAAIDTWRRNLSFSSFSVTSHCFWPNLLSLSKKTEKSNKRTTGVSIANLAKVLIS